MTDYFVCLFVCLLLSVCLFDCLFSFLWMYVIGVLFVSVCICTCSYPNSIKILTIIRIIQIIFSFLKWVSH